jgi:DNA-binding GntR family transcriptional regulator
MTRRSSFRRQVRRYPTKARTGRAISCTTWDVVSNVREESGATRSDGVYEELRLRIVRGTLRPNQRLIEAELSEQLGVSRTPVREGLQRLAADGLILSRRRGWVVREHTAEEIVEIYEIRAALEGYAARLAASRASDTDVARIADLHRREAGGLVRSPRDHLVEVNDAFHEAIMVAAGNRRLADQIRRNREFYFNYRIGVLYTDAEATASVVGHEEIVAALLSRDEASAEDAARRHVTEALTTILTKVR